MVINEGPVRNVINKVKKSYNHIMGNSNANYDMPVRDTKDAKLLLSKSPIGADADKFDSDAYNISADPDRSYIKFEFSARRVPDSLADKVNPNNRKAKDSLYKYVTNYDKNYATVTMELPVDKKTMKSWYKDDAGKSNSNKDNKASEDKPRPVTQDDYEEYDGYIESMMTPTQLTITGKRTLQCDDEGHEILDEGLVIHEAYYKEIKTKSVYDADGFTTEYTLYKDDDGNYLCIFGDRELYTPDNTEPDWEGETEEEAEEWFNDYEGPGAGSTRLEFDDEFEDDEDFMYEPDEEFDLDVEDKDKGDEESEEEIEESIRLSEDYWFGGDGKLDNQNNTSDPFESQEEKDEIQDKTDQDKLNLLDKVVDKMDNELSDGELNEEILDETPGLTLSVPRIAYKDENDIEGRLEIDINGKTYKYRLNPGTDLTTMELVDKITGMQKYSDGKALAYLKRNAHTVTEGLELRDATQVSNLGQYKRSSIDLIEGEENPTDALNAVIDNYGVTSSPLKGPSFILPNGQYLDLSSVTNHSDVEYWLDQQGLSIKADYTRRSGSPTLRSLGCIRVDTPKYYIQLPEDNITVEQYAALKDWIEFAFVECNVPFIEVMAAGTSPVRYRYEDDVDADYIVDRIRRYYITDHLYEAHEDLAEGPYPTEDEEV